MLQKGWFGSLYYIKYVIDLLLMTRTCQQPFIVAAHLAHFENVFLCTYPFTSKSQQGPVQPGLIHQNSSLTILKFLKLTKTNDHLCQSSQELSYLPSS